MLTANTCRDLLQLAQAIALDLAWRPQKAAAVFGPDSDDEFRRRYDLRVRRRRRKRNTVRPHASLGQLTSVACAAASCAGPKPGCGGLGCVAHDRTGYEIGRTLTILSG